MNPVKVFDHCRAVAAVLALGLPQARQAWAQTSGALPPGPMIRVIAPTAPLQQEARRILRFCRWQPTEVLAHVVVYTIRDTDLLDMASHDTFPAEPPRDGHGSRRNSRFPSVPGLRCGL